MREGKKLRGRELLFSLMFLWISVHVVGWSNSFSAAV